jgi:hypothetical protein
MRCKHLRVALANHFLKSSQNRSNVEKLKPFKITEADEISNERIREKTAKR